MIREEAELTQIPTRGPSFGVRSGGTLLTLVLDHPVTCQPPASPEPWPKVSVVIPTLNEAAQSAARLRAAAGRTCTRSSSSTATRSTTRSRSPASCGPDVRVVTQTRRGKGNALACGFAAATGDIIVMLDADGSADPAEIPQFVEALARRRRLREGHAVRRRRRQQRHHPAAPARQPRARPASSTCSSAPATPTSATATTPSGGTTSRCSAWTRTDVPARPAAAELWGDGFEIETLINIRVAQAGLEVAEVPSFEHARIHGASNLNAVATAGACCAPSSPSATTTTMSKG